MSTRVLFPALALTALLAAPGGARACDPPCCAYRTVVCYQSVTDYETRQVPYAKEVTCHDACGRPYTVTRICYRAVRVPVTHVVAVAKRVRVCD